MASQPQTPIVAAEATSDSTAIPPAGESPSVLEEANVIRKACLVPLGSVVANEQDQLDLLQERVHTLLSLQGDYLRDNLEGWTGTVLN